MVGIKAHVTRSRDMMFHPNTAAGAKETGWTEGTRSVAETEVHVLGGLLRQWRRRRRMSQLDLACDAGISTRHPSFLEPGRSRPGRQRVLHLAGCLDVPLRERNVLLTAAGFAPVFEERAFTEPALGAVRRNIEILLAAHDPNPALAVGRHWKVLGANRGVCSRGVGGEER